MTNDFDLKSIRKSLNAMRNKHGADTPTGHTCSNLTEQLANYPHTSGDARKRLEKFIGDSVKRLAKLTAVNAEDHQ
jgi:hypothetical protein